MIYQGFCGRVIDLSVEGCQDNEHLCMGADSAQAKQTCTDCSKQNEIFKYFDRKVVQTVSEFICGSPVVEVATGRKGKIDVLDADGPARCHLVLFEPEFEGQTPVSRKIWMHERELRLDTDVQPETPVVEALAPSPEPVTDPHVAPEVLVVPPEQHVEQEQQSSPVEHPIGLPTDLLPPGAVTPAETAALLNVLPDLPAAETVKQDVKQDVVPATLPPVTLQPAQPTAAVDDYTGVGAFLPGINLLGACESDDVDIEALLKEIPEMQGGPSKGGMSWHTLYPFEQCPRMAYYNSVRALRRKGKPPKHFAIGTLLHACFELHYRTGGQKTFEPIEIAHKAGLYEEAAVVKKCLLAYLEKYAAEEAQTWDVRGLEVQATYFLPPIKVNGKQVRIPLTCRHDALIALRDPGAPCAPYGPVDSGTFILDWKCLHEDSELWLRDGRKVRAGDILSGKVHGDIYVPTTHEGRTEFEKAEFADNGMQECVRVTLKSGRQEMWTTNHPVLTDGKWIEAGKLKKNTWVACGSLEKIQGKYYPNQELLELLGYWIGDGCISRDTLRIHSKRMDFHKRLCALGGTGPYGHGGDTAAYTAFKKSSALTMLLHDVGLFGLRSPKRFVPPFIFELDNVSIARFLSGLWSTDGEVKLRDEKRPGLHVVYHSMSGQLARDVQQLLWRLGIWSSRSTSKVHYKGEVLVYHHVAVAGHEAKERFLDQLGEQMIYRGSMTLDKARTALAEIKPGGYYSQDKNRIPTSLVVGILQDAGKTKVGKRYASVLKHQKGTSRWIVAEMSEEVPELHRLLTEDVHWDRVESVEPMGVCQTVAITVPANPVFLSADGIISHNTTSALTADLTKGYGMDGQFLMNALLYERTEQEAYGPLRGVIISLVAKHKVMHPDKSLKRIYATTDSATIDEFEKTEVIPVAEAFYRKLADERCSDPAFWPKRHASCMTRYGPCQFFDICDTAPGGEDAIIDAQFEENPDRQIKIENFLTPDKDTPAATVSVTPEVAAKEYAKHELKQTRKQERDARKQDVLSAFGEAVSAFPVFQAETYMTGIVARNDVTKAFAKAISEAWPADTKFEIACEAQGTIELCVYDKGLRWVCEGGKGSFAWSTLARELSASWWNPEINEPQ